MNRSNLPLNRSKSKHVLVTLNHWLICAPLVAVSLSGMFGLVANTAVGQETSATQDNTSDLDAIILRDQQRQIQLVKQISEPTVCVHSADGGGGGSGVLISSSGLALTNYHVVQPCGSYMQCTLNDGRLYDAVIVSVDPTGDVALIQLLGRDDFPYAVLGDSDLAKAGQICYAVGNPFLLATNRQPSVTKGIISGTHRYQYPSGTMLEYTDCLQIDASVNPGNSGGPLFDNDGKLIGINGRCSFEKRSRINVGVAYAISINQIKLFLGVLQSGRVVDHASFAATMTSDSDGQVVVSDLLADSDAMDCGLQYGDVLISFGGKVIGSVNEFKNQLGIYPSHWFVPIEFRRGNENFKKTVRLAALHSFDEMLATTTPFRPRPLRRPLPLESDHDQLNQNVKTAIPDAARSRIEFRLGFTNYYFNRQVQTRIQKTWTQFRLDASLTQSSQLIFEGDDQDRGPLKLAVGLAEAGFLSDLETRTAKASVLKEQTTQNDAKTTVDPSQLLSDRQLLLQGLIAWHRYMQNGLKSFPVAYYSGKYPSRYSSELQDVLFLNLGEVDIELFVDATSGQPKSLICTQHGQVPGCEVYFEQWKNSPQGTLPHAFKAIYRGNTFMNFQASGASPGKANSKNE